MIIIGKAIKGSIVLNEKLRKPSDVKLSQKNTLLKLLKKAKNTQFGKEFNFSSIISSSDPERYYREILPIFDYNKLYEEWWRYSLEGKENICWPGKIKYFALSSGTSGSPSKRIPVTSDMIQAIKKAGFNQLSAVKNHPVDKNIYGTQMLLLGGSTKLEKNLKHYSGDLSGILTANLPLWLNFIYKPGIKISKERDWNTKIQKIIQEAPNWNIGIISGVPSWVKLLIEKIIDYHHLDSIHDIWPNLSIYSHGGVSLKPYKDGLKKLMGKEIYFLETYLASEGFIAYEKNANEGMSLILGNGIYYEFIPFDNKHFNTEGKLISSEGVVNYDSIKEGVEYALLMSTCSGAWRYLIGDTVKFVSGRLIITGRIQHFLSMCGEHLSVDNMNDAINMLSKELSISINEYTVVGTPFQNGFAHKWYVSVDNLHLSVASSEELLDGYLQALNDDYKTERKSVLLKVNVVFVPEHLFYSWMEAENKIGGQAKFPRVLNEKQLKSWENHIRINGIKSSIN